MLSLRVTRLTHEAEDVIGIELRSPDAAVLPAFTAGAHLDVQTPSGVLRQYSLTNDPTERDRYCLGIGLARDSRGGSRSLHQKLRVGDSLQVGDPRALFGLCADAREHLFIAGGIGITPILSMIRVCIAQRMPWRLLYCVRSRSRGAFLWELATYSSQVTLHVDEERAGAYPDIALFLAGAAPGAHVYCCGPGPLMDSVARQSADAAIPAQATHFERFTAAAPVPAGADRPFRIVLSRAQQRLEVGAGASMLETLEAHGFAVPFGCREGMCGACETPLLEGEADHRDCILSDSQRAENRSVMLCVSRARGEELVLDL
jgi:tetrachlorobenzoquinone reductase